MKRLFALILTVTLLVTPLTLAASANQNDVAVYLNGFYVEFETPAKLIGERTMVPVRKLAEALGATVEWYGDTRVVVCKRGDTTVSLTVDSPELYKNGKLFATMDAAPFIVENSGNFYTLVPMRAFADAFSCALHWADGAQSIYLTDVRDDTVMVVGNFPISTELYEYYYNDTVNYLISKNPKFVTDISNSGEVPALVLERILSFCAILELASELGYSPYGIYDAYTVNNSFNAYKSYYGDDFLEELALSGMTENIFKSILFISYFQDCILSDIEYSHGNLSNESKADAIMTSEKLIRTAHILLSDKMVAETILEEAKSASDDEFFALMEEHTIDTASARDRNGYYIAPGETIPPYDNTSFALSVGETSDIVESADGYYIIRRLEKNKEYISANIDAFWNYYLVSLYNAAISEAAVRLSYLTVFTENYSNYDFETAFANAVEAFYANSGNAADN